MSRSTSFFNSYHTASPRCSMSDFESANTAPETCYYQKRGEACSICPSCRPVTSQTEVSTLTPSQSSNRHGSETRSPFESDARSKAPPFYLEARARIELETLNDHITQLEMIEKSTLQVGDTEWTKEMENQKLVQLKRVAHADRALQATLAQLRVEESWTWAVVTRFTKEAGGNVQQRVRSAWMAYGRKE